LAPIWLWRRPAFRSPGLPLAAGVVVLVPAFSALIVLRDITGPALLLAIMMAIWISDTAALIAGRRFGRRKLAPAISPGKTWEGVFGGLGAAVLYGSGLSLLSGPEFLSGQPRWPLPGFAPWILLLLILVVAGVIGDLFESQMKRAAGVKDSGEILPGHGGVLDRIDALTAALPLAAVALGAGT
jgi:phosphatidate cytidylyltransferase